MFTCYLLVLFLVLGMKYNLIVIHIHILCFFFSVAIFAFTVFGLRYALSDFVYVFISRFFSSI